MRIESELSGCKWTLPSGVASDVDVGHSESVALKIVVVRVYGAGHIVVVVFVEMRQVGKLIASVDVLNEEVGKFIELVVGSEGESMVAAEPCDIVFDGEDILV